MRLRDLLAPIRPLAALLAAFVAIDPAGGAVTVRDTTVAGVPSWALRPASGPGPRLVFRSDRGIDRADLAFVPDSVLSCWHRQSFPQMAGRTRPSVFPTRVESGVLVVPVATLGPLLRARGVAPGVREAAVAPLPRPASRTPEPAESAVGGRDTTPPRSVAAESAVALPPAVPVAARPEHSGPFVVVIDAGHGGKDPGALGRRSNGTEVHEKDAALGVARALRDQLRGQDGVKVVMTRDTDVFLELKERTTVANQAKGDLFISLHCNSLPLNSSRRDEVQGFMVYLLREAKDENDRAIERRENEVIRYETGERAAKESLSPVEWMVLEHQLNLYTKESERFAELAVKGLSGQGPTRRERTGAGQAGFFVLVGALMPSVLVEMGYMSNPHDVEALMDPARQKEIAKALAHAVEAFRLGRR